MKRRTHLQASFGDGRVEQGEYFGRQCILKTIVCGMEEEVLPVKHADAEGQSADLGGEQV